MKNKLHHSTQKAINEYAAKLLHSYRISRTAGTTPDMARFQSMFQHHTKLNGNVYCIVSARDRKFRDARNNWRTR